MCTSQNQNSIRICLVKLQMPNLYVKTRGYSSLLKISVHTKEYICDSVLVPKALDQNAHTAVINW